MNFHKETTFESASIGEIPKDWKEVTLEDVTLSHKQGFYSNESYTDKGVRLVRITDLLNPKISYETMPFLSVDDRTYEQFKVTVGDFLFARSGAIGRHGIVTKEVPCIFASYIIRFRFDESRVSNYFLSELFQAPFVNSQFLSKMHGATNININAENIKSIKIPLPPLAEQKNIVSVLGVVDSAIELADKVIAKTERLKKGLMQKLLTRGMGHTEFKNTAIGIIPKTWDVVKLGDVFDFLDSQRIPLRKQDRAKRKGCYPYYGAQGIIDWVDGYIYEGEHILLTEDGANLKTKVLPLSYKVTGQFWVNNPAHVLKNKTNMNLDFFVSALNFLEIGMHVVGSAQPKLNQADARKILLPFPSCSEQKEISEIFFAAEKKLQLELKEKETLERIKTSLMDSLLTGKVRISED